MMTCSTSAQKGSKMGREHVITETSSAHYSNYKTQIMVENVLNWVVEVEWH